jgi:hypothetical protein
VARTYLETFDRGPGGWIADLCSPLPVWDGVAYCVGPWSVDANHAPPGAGYLHLLMYLLTDPKAAAAFDPGQHGVNRFLADRHSTNLTDAELTVRLRGTLDLTGPLCNYHRPVPCRDLGGARLLLLAQARLPHTTANYVLTGQPFSVTPDWSEQTVRLAPDARQWTCLGARHDLSQVYGCGDVAAVLADVNVDLIFVLFPLRVVPVEVVDDADRRWAAKDYKVDLQYLPKGLVMFDTVRIQYAR